MIPIEMALFAVLVWLLGYLAGTIRRTAYQRALEGAARMALVAVHEFCGFMDGMACGPAESEMCRRCLPLAKLLDYDDANENEEE